MRQRREHESFTDQYRMRQRQRRAHYCGYLPYTGKAAGMTASLPMAEEPAPEGVHAFCFGSPVSMGLHVLSTFFKGEHGFASASATRKLIRKIEEWNPDVIQLHNIHGFVLQTELLFDYLKKAGKPVVWTLHDCWPYTGHCAFYDYNKLWTSGGIGCKDCQRVSEDLSLCIILKIIRRTIINERRRPLPVWRTLTIVTPSQMAGRTR